MDAQLAAKRWADEWQRAWSSHEVEPIAALYAEDAVYRSHPFRDPERSARDFVERVFADEETVECRFGDPIGHGDRAAVEWWAVYTEGGEEHTLAGVTVLRFADDGRVAEHLDYWVEQPGRHDRRFA